MPKIVVPTGELTGSLVVGAEQRIHAILPRGHSDGRRIIISRIVISYRLEPTDSTVARSDDPLHDCKPNPNGENAHPHDDATGHVEPRYSGVGC